MMQVAASIVRAIIQLALALAALIAVLSLTIISLTRLNARSYRREREKARASARMQTVMSTALDGVIVCDAKGRILNFGPAAEAIFGHRPGKVLGKANQAGIDRWQPAGEQRVVGQDRLPLEAKRADGSIFRVDLAIQTVTTGEGDIFIAFLRDISYRVAAEAELLPMKS
jgi:PAS domain S-box-containing protein